MWPRPILRFLILNVLGHVHEHGSGAPFHRNGHRVSDVVGQLFDVAHQDIVLGDRHRHTDDIGFLKRIAPEHRTADLTGNRQHR